MELLTSLAFLGDQPLCCRARVRERVRSCDMAIFMVASAATRGCDRRGRTLGEPTESVVVICLTHLNPQILYLTFCLVDVLMKKIHVFFFFSNFCC